MRFEPNPIDSRQGSCYPRAMRTRILLFITAFAFLPGCKKTPPPPTPEQVATAEKEIGDAVYEVVNTTINLEGEAVPGRAIAYKEELDGFKSKLIAVREKNKTVIPMARSEEMASQLIQEGLEEQRTRLKAQQERFRESDRRLEKLGIPTKKTE